MGAFAERGENKGMEAQKAKWKAEIMKEVEAEVDALMAWDASKGRVLTVAEMEERLLGIRQSLGERLMEKLMAYQGEKQEAVEVAPMSAASGKRLQNKGKKTIGS